MRFRYKLPLLLVLVALAGSVGYYLLRSGAIAVASERGPNTSKVVRQTTTKGATAMGNIVLSRQESLSFGVGGVVERVSVKPGDEVRKGQVLARLDTRAMERAVEVAKADLEKAMAELTLEQDSQVREQDSQVRAQASLDAAVLDARSGVRNATVALDNSKRQLAITQKSATVSKDPRDRETDHSAAEVAYGEALKKRDAGTLDDLGLSRVYNNLLAAKERLESAREQAAVALSTAENAILVAEDVLRKAKDALAQAEDAAAKGPSKVTTMSLMSKQFAVLSKQVALDAAQAQPDAARIVAPFDGLVSEVKVVAGSRVTTQTAAIVLVDPSSTQVKLLVDEIDISQVSLNQAAKISVVALPELDLKGTVTAISLVGQVAAGVVSFPVTVTIQVPVGVILRNGMSVEAILSGLGDTGR